MSLWCAGGLNLAPVLGILMLFIMLRIGKLDQNIYNPFTYVARADLVDTLPSYPVIQVRNSFLLRLLVDDCIANAVLFRLLTCHKTNIEIPVCFPL